MKKFLAASLTALTLSTAATFAQLETPGSTTGVNAALTKLFGDITAFSAKATITVYGTNQQERVATPMDFALLDNKMRVDIDTTQIRDKNMPAMARDALKQVRMDRVISITRPDKKTTYIIFPGQQVYVNSPLPTQDVETFQKTPKISKTAVGKETLDGHPCVKNRVVITDDKGRQEESTTWNATDLKDFPVQIMTREKNETVVIRYRQIQFAKPDAKSFEPPAGYKEYGSVNDLMIALPGKILRDAEKE